MYLNKAFVIGNLTRDPEIRALPSGIKVCTFSIATNRVWKDKNGARQESADYHNIVVFGRQAETAAQYLKKGASALVEGRMQTRSWDDQSGQKKYRTEIVADRVQFGSRTGGQGGGSGFAGAAGSGSSAGSESTSANPAKSDNAPSDKDMPPADAIAYPEEEINPDDIPF
jgi:single-strand DNA-binding protein